MRVQDMEGFDEVMARVLYHLSPQQRFAGLDPEQALLVLPDALLLALPEDFKAKLSDTTRDKIRQQLEPKPSRFEGTLLTLLAPLSPKQRMVGLSPEQRMNGLSPEQVLGAFAPEERLEGLDPDLALVMLPDTLLCALPEEFMAKLSEATRDRIRRRLGQ